MTKICRALPKNAERLYPQLHNDEIPHAKGEIIGRGEHGIVITVKDSDLVMKLFSMEAKAGEYFDYEYLELLDGLDCVPVMYAYKVHEYVLIDRIYGINLKKYYEANQKFPEGLKDLIKKAINDIYSRRVSLHDLKTQSSIIWVESTKSIKIIDFGVCSKLGDNITDTYVERVRDMLIERIYKDLQECEKCGGF